MDYSSHSGHLPFFIDRLRHFGHRALLIFPPPASDIFLIHDETGYYFYFHDYFINLDHNFRIRMA